MAYSYCKWKKYCILLFQILFGSWSVSPAGPPCIQLHQLCCWASGAVWGGGDTGERGGDQERHFQAARVLRMWVHSGMGALGCGRTSRWIAYAVSSSFTLSSSSLPLPSPFPLLPHLPSPPFPPLPSSPLPSPPFSPPLPSLLLSHPPPLWRLHQPCHCAGLCPNECAHTAPPGRHGAEQENHGGLQHPVRGFGEGSIQSCNGASYVHTYVHCISSVTQCRKPIIELLACIL